MMQTALRTSVIRKFKLTATAVATNPAAAPIVSMTQQEEEFPIDRKVWKLPGLTAHTLVRLRKPCSPGLSTFTVMCTFSTLIARFESFSVFKLLVWGLLPGNPAVKA